MLLKKQSLVDLLLLLAVSACITRPAASPASTRLPAQASTLTVLAAASLTEAFTEMGRVFESQNPGVKVVFSFAGSQQLAQQLGQGVPADVFASASSKYMDASVQAKRVEKSSVQTLVKNRLVVIYPKDNPAGLNRLQDLAKAGVKLDLADKSVPAGHYSLDFLDRAVKDPTFPPDYKERVLKNIVSYEENVKAVLTKVSLGEVDAGIVYSTDITWAAASQVGRLDIPKSLNPIAIYPIAAISDSQQASLARAFVALALSKDGQQIMVKYGFIPVAAPE